MQNHSDESSEQEPESPLETATVDTDTEMTPEVVNKVKEVVEILLKSEQKSKIRRFLLKRIEDETGMSGTGYVAEGTEFSDGTCVIKWKSATSSLGIYHSVVEMIHIHGHGGTGKTVIDWIDEHPSAPAPTKQDNTQEPTPPTTEP